MTLRKAIVVEVHPQDHSVDLVMLDDGTRHIGVQVLTPNGSARTGMVDLPEIPKLDNKWDITKRNGQDMEALVDFVGRTPVVTGFTFPQINQMLLKDPKARRFRHQSDVETLIDGDGNMQISHPSGTYIRIGEAVDADTLSGKYADNSATDRNQAKAVNVHIAMAGGTATFTIAPNGAVSLTTQSTVAVEAQGAVTLHTQSTMDIHAAGAITMGSDASIALTAPRIDFN